MRKKKSTNQKKANADAAHYAEENYTSVPHTFVFHRGQIGKNVGQLVLDMRRVMEPFTARALKVRKKNVLKDFVSVAGPLGVTHFSVFTKTNHSINMRLARLPKGPTLSFRVLKYTLIKDVVSSLKRHRMHGEQFTHHPLLVLNNFSTAGMQIKLMATMFQNMFPSINVHTMSLNSVKRCVLLNYDPVSQEIELRHYNLKVVPVGMSRGVKKLMQEKFPNMSKLDDISELLTKGINLSESEAEQDGDHNLTELPQVYAGRGNMASQQSAVRLTEIGPRMTLQLVKISEGMGEGKVLYHSFITKTEKELQDIIKRKEARLKVKEERRKKQEENVALKKEIYGANRKKSLEAMKLKREREAQVSEDDVEDPGNQEEKAPAEESEDEAEYYRQAVGEEPEEDMFPAGKRKRGPGKSPQPFKKRKSTQGKAPPQDKQKLKSPHRGNKEAGKRFGDRKAPDGKKRFRKSDGGKNFGKKREMGNRFAGKRKGETDKRFGRRNTSKARPAMKGQKNSRGTKEFRRKKGKS